jgi:Helix-turn-helix domain
VKTHRHKVVARSSAAALGAHGSSRFEDCSCGAFRLRSVSKWIEPANSIEAFTIAQACEFLHCGYDVVYRLIWKGLVHVEKRLIPGGRKPAWFIPVSELNRFRFNRERMGAPRVTAIRWASCSASC